MRHRKSLTAEMMRRAAINACKDVEASFSRDGITEAASGCRACANAIKGLPVVFDQVPRLNVEEVNLIDAAMKWANSDTSDPVSQKALTDAAMALRSARAKG